MLLHFLLLGALASAHARSPSCLDESGRAVDYFAAVKPPKSSGAGFFAEGSGLVMSFPGRGALAPSKASVMAGGGSALEKTLAPVYAASNRDPSLAWVMYNDQPFKDEGHEERARSNPASIRAHMKGVLHFDARGGFWLIHSVPQYPPHQNDSYAYGSSQLLMGQSFLCLSLDKTGINTALRALYTNHAGLFDVHSPDALLNAYDQFPLVASGQWQRSPVGTSETVSTASAQWTVFSKSAAWNSFLYTDLVAPTLKSDIYVETWTRGPTRLVIPTYCRNTTVPYSVMNVTEVSMAGMKWTQSNDHSKWAVSAKGGTGYVCIGDINRQFSQNDRGGGTVCTNAIPELTQSFYLSIANAHDCTP